MNKSKQLTKISEAMNDGYRKTQEIVSKILKEESNDQKAAERIYNEAPPYWEVVDLADMSRKEGRTKVAELVSEFDYH